MNVKVSKDYGMWETIRKDDYTNNRLSSITKPCEYHKWEDSDVTFDELKEMIEKGYAIMINC